MRMKESDDYLTARAANPRTGLISPSVYAPSPRTPITPESPGEALKLSTSHDHSARKESNERPALTRANESRKIGSGPLGKWCAPRERWISDKTFAAACQTSELVGGSLTTSQSQPMLKDDQFVCHMPSAREPQPFNYPGRTPAEIDAFEHYRQKTRKVSAEGYDKRVLCNTSLSFGQTASGSGCCHRPDSTTTTQHINADLQQPCQRIHVAKRAMHTYGKDQDIPSTPDTVVSAASFAPFASPRTPVSKDVGPDDTLQKTIKLSRGARDVMPEHDVAPVQGEPLGSTPRLGVRPKPGGGCGRGYNPCKVDDSKEKTVLGIEDLRQLPKVRLVHPELASLPRRDRVTRQSGDGLRKCSFGCLQDNDTGQCIGVRRTSGGSIHETQGLLFEGRPRGQGISHEIEGLLFALLGMALNACTVFRMPDVRKLYAFNSEKATAQQKVDALRAALLLSAQALACLFVVTVAWRLGAAVLQIIGVLLWPLIVPFKILRWIATGE
ncbi:hypothetical protein KC367_g2057 [Hortaea werneckii]|nr:hypothetical protein KC342_g9799 [Hortaea werneckii]KAI7094490.1 hypothetical protein KC339_g11572 [Hortaea werneckii]KAI7223426.1 hypothetical protein KC365_g11135 [Hortaea werneckii]KAI7299827.1 hypothetical protein KC340_g13619 [Hortaea werneckii]KAI7349158.1 hypothetical protein KC354_g13332 [Hortaea werneckii]